MQRLLSVCTDPNMFTMRLPHTRRTNLWEEEEKKAKEEGEKEEKEEDRRKNG